MNYQNFFSMRLFFIRKIKIINIILLIILAVILCILSVSGCRNNLNCIVEAANLEKSSKDSIDYQQSINNSEQIINQAAKKPSGEITADDNSYDKKNDTKFNDSKGINKSICSNDIIDFNKDDPNTYNHINKSTDEVLFSFSVCGDNRPADDYLTQPEVFLKLLELIKNQDISFHMTAGDIINGQTSSEDIIKRQFSDYLDAIKILPVINFVSPGNHDVANDTTRKYFLEMINHKAFQEAANNKIQIFTAGESSNIISLNSILESEGSTNNSYYYFEFKGIFFIVLNAFENGYWGAVKAGQLEWLENVLKNLESEEVFIFIHTPVYSVLNPDTITDGTKHIAFSSKENLNYVRELFKKYKVDGVFSGHEHVYNKQFHDGTTFIITALSGEYPFLPVEEGGFQHFCKVDIKHNSWVLSIIDSDGKLNYQEEIKYN